MLSDSDHHVVAPPARAKRPRSPPLEPPAPDVFTTPSSAAPAKKKTRSDAELSVVGRYKLQVPDAPHDGVLVYGMSGRDPPDTPYRTGLAKVYTSLAKVLDVLSDMYEFVTDYEIHEHDLRHIEEITDYSEGLARYGAQVLRASGYPTKPHIGMKEGSAQTDTPPNPAPAAKTYAAAASGPTSAPRPAPNVHRARAPPPRKRAAEGERRANTAQPAKGTPPTAPPPRASGSSHRHTRLATRLIVRYHDAGVLHGRTRPHSAVLQKSLNDALGGDWVAGIAYSRNDRLILYTKAPYSARELALQGSVLRPVIRSAFALLDDPEPLFETDDPWSKIVVQRVPLPLLGDSTDSMEDKVQAFLANACSSNGFSPDIVRRMHFLCPKGKEEEYFSRSTAQAPQLVSVLLCLSDSRLANRLLRTGAFWQGSHCRVSQYRERRRTASG